MRAPKPTILGLVFTLFTSSSYAQVQVNENWGFDGRLRLAERIEEKPSGTEDSLRGQFRLNGWVGIAGKNNCLKARVRITTGNSFNSEWYTTGVGNVDADIQIGVRHLYLDTNCIKENIRVEVGAIPARPNGGPGNLGLTENGWIDGLRITLTNGDKTRDVYLSVGEISETKNPNILTRDHTGINHGMIEVKQVVSSKVTVHGSVAVQDKQIFSRAGLNWVITEYVNWLKNFGGEALMVDDNVIGGMIYTDVNLKNVNLRTFVTRIDPAPTDQERLGLLFKNFYGYGSNAYFELTHDILNKKAILNFRGRIGDAGKLIEAGVTVPFKK